MRKTMFFAAIAALVFGTAGSGLADPKHCPPGHAKKGWCSPGKQVEKRAVRREYVVIGDHEKYGLRPPRDGYYYGVLDDEVFLISKATEEIVEGFGAVRFLINR